MKSEPVLSGIEVALLDRDGVINRKLPEGQYVRSRHEFQLLPGVPQAIKQLNDCGITTILLTNQRGIALGKYDERDLEDIHIHLRDELRKIGAKIDGIFFCPHDKGQCDCRKPGIGLLRQAFADFPRATKNNTLLIGDSLSDIQAGRAFGLRTIFIQGDSPHAKPGAAEAASLADYIARSLPEAVNCLCC